MVAAGGNRARSIRAPPDDAYQLMDIVGMSGSDIGAQIDSIFDGALYKTNTSKDLPGLFRVTDVKSDISSLVRKLSPVVLGLMRNELHPINQYLVPVILTNDMTFHTEVTVFEPQFPNQVAPMGPPRMIQETRYSNMTHMTRYGFSFLIDGDVNELPEGKADAQMKLLQISASFMQLLAFNTVAALGESDPDTNYMLAVDTMSEREYVSAVMDRVNWSFAAHKRKLGFFSLILEQKMQMAALNQIEPTDVIYPEPKRMIFATSPMLVDYQHAGDTAHDMYTGKIKIEQVHGLNLWPTPTIPSTRDRYGQLQVQRRFGNYALLCNNPEMDPEEPGIYLFDLNIDNDRFIPLEEILGGVMYMVPADPHSTAMHIEYFKLAVVLNAAKILTELGLAGMPEFNQFFAGVRSIRDGFSTREYRGHIDGTFNAFNHVFGEAGALNYANAPGTSTYALVAAALDCVAGAGGVVPHDQLYNFKSHRTAYFGEIYGRMGADEGPTFAHCTDTSFVVRVKMALELHSRLGGALSALFRTGGAFTGLPLNRNPISASNKLFQEMAALSLPMHANPVFFLNIDRLLNEHFDMPSEFSRGSFYFEEGTMIPKVELLVLNPVTSFKQYDFLLTRVADTQACAKFIIMNRGQDVAFAACSAPIMVANQDSATQVKHVSVTQYLGVHVTKERMVRNVPDAFYNGIIGGSNSQIMSHDDVFRFRNSQFVFPDRTFPAVNVIPVPKGSMKHRREFVNARGTMEIKGFDRKQTPDYPHADYWSWRFGWHTAISEYMWDDNRRNIIATALMPCKYGFVGRDKKPRFVHGNTHHGKFGEEIGARDVRDIGDRLYIRTED